MQWFLGFIRILFFSNFCILKIVYVIVDLIAFFSTHFVSSIPSSDTSFQTTMNLNLIILISFFSVVLANPFAAHPPASCSSGIIKRVEMFDTLWIVAMLNGYTVEEIKEANPQLSDNWDLIFVGGKHDVLIPR
jgi:hypothetical protein